MNLIYSNTLTVVLMVLLCLIVIIVLSLLIHKTNNTSPEEQYKEDIEQERYLHNYIRKHSSTNRHRVVRTVVIYLIAIVLSYITIRYQR